jgi:hypothetical protein
LDFWFENIPSGNPEFYSSRFTAEHRLETGWPDEVVKKSSKNVHQLILCQNEYTYIIMEQKESRNRSTFYCFKNYHPILWRDSISRPIAPISSVAGGDDTTRGLFTRTMISVSLCVAQRRSTGNLQIGIVLILSFVASCKYPLDHATTAKLGYFFVWLNG